MCPYADCRDDALVSYLYADGVPEDLQAFAAHLPTCGACQQELTALGDLRAQLAHWAPPEPAHGVGRMETPALRVVSSSVPPPAPQARRRVPLWAQAVAAVLVGAVAASVANLEVTSTPDGVLVRTGWMHRRPVATASAPDVARATAATAPASTHEPSATADAPWRAELAALGEQLRAEMSARPTATSAGAVDQAVEARVRALVADSERRQQRELALRVAEVARETQTQRQADLAKIDRTLGVMSSRTGAEVMRTQQQLNSLAQQVSEQR